MARPVTGETLPLEDVVALALHEAEVAVVASPTYWATHAGLLELFLAEVGTATWPGWSPSR